MPFKADSMKILNYMLLLYSSFYMLEKGRALHEPSVVHNLLHVLHKGRRSEVLYHILSVFLEVIRAKCNIILLFFSTHSQHYSISSCAYSAEHNNRRLLLSRKFKANFWKNLYQWRFYYETPEVTFFFQYLPEKKSKQKELERKSKQ